MKEMMAPIYSVVIPVYNAEKYLESCVNSVLTQQTSSVYEVILVNDGSADRSPEICDRLAAQEPCVKVIHQKNQGVSAARNAGIAAASGVYLLFLDGDDCWDPSLLQSLDQLILQQPDLIEFGYQIFGEQGVQKPVLPPVEISGITGQEYFEIHKARGCMPIGSSCTAAFSRRLLEEHGLRFPTDLSYGEDFSFHMHCLKAAKSVISLTQSLYGYRMNEASATHTPSVKKIRDMLHSSAQMYRQFPCALFANYYCMKIMNLEKLTKSDALQLKVLLRENRDILRDVSGRKMRLARLLYRIFGYYHASRLIQRCIGAQHSLKG